jgi:hypothetical protein
MESHRRKCGLADGENPMSAFLRLSGQRQEFFDCHAFMGEFVGTGMAEANNNTSSCSGTLRFLLAADRIN